MKAAATQGLFLVSQYAQLLTGLTDEHLGHEPAPGVKTAGWLLGHLVITGDFARRLAGLPPMAPREWRAIFGPGTTPSRDPATYPPMAALIETFRAVYRDLAARAPGASPDVLGTPNPFEAARPAFPTGGSFVAYLLTGHLGYHLGQLSAWRSTSAATDPRLR